MTNLINKYSPTYQPIIPGTKLRGKVKNIVVKPYDGPAYSLEEDIRQYRQKMKELEEFGIKEQKKKNIKRKLPVFFSAITLTSLYFLFKRNKT